MYRSAVLDNRPLGAGIIARPESVVQRGRSYTLVDQALGVNGTMLFDTGAQVSTIDLAIATELSLDEVDTDAYFLGIGGRQAPRRFVAAIYFPESDIGFRGYVYGIPLREIQGVDAIIGMDILSEFVLTIHGPNRTVTLAQP